MSSRDARTRRRPERTAPRPTRPLLHRLLSRGSLSPGTRQRLAERETGNAATVTERKSRCACESGRAAPSLRMARGSLEQFSAAKWCVIGPLEVYVVQRMNPFAVRSLKRPGCVDHAFSPHSSSRTASGSGGLIMMNDRVALDADFLATPCVALTRFHCAGSDRP